MYGGWFPRSLASIHQASFHCQPQDCFHSCKSLLDLRVNTVCVLDEGLVEAPRNNQWEPEPMAKSSFLGSFSWTLTGRILDMSHRTKPEVTGCQFILMVAFPPHCSSQAAVSLLLPGITSQINELRANPCLRLSFWGESKPRSLSSW